MLHTTEEVIGRIHSGARLILSAERNLLEQLPAGNWIGGSIPYFVEDGTGKCARDRIFVREVPGWVEGLEIKTHSKETIGSVVREAPENGISIILVPFGCGLHYYYAEESQNFEGMFEKPLIGWVSGTHLDDQGSSEAIVVNGFAKEVLADKAVVAHFSFPREKRAEVVIRNPFEQGTGDAIQFKKSGFGAKTCTVNGEDVDFAEYLRENKVDIRYPLVADYFGHSINVSIRDVDRDRGVGFYAPVFSRVEYRFARPVDSLRERIKKEIEGVNENAVFACNCVLNFLYGELEGNRVPGPAGPMTFGEIAYQLLNQTMVFVEVVDQ